MANGYGLFLGFLPLVLGFACSTAQAGGGSWFASPTKPCDSSQTGQRGNTSRLGSGWSPDGKIKVYIKVAEVALDAEHQLLLANLLKHNLGGPIPRDAILMSVRRLQIVGVSLAKLGHLGIENVDVNGSRKRGKIFDLRPGPHQGESKVYDFAAGGGGEVGKLNHQKPKYLSHDSGSLLSGPGFYSVSNWVPSGEPGHRALELHGIDPETRNRKLIRIHAADYVSEAERGKSGCIGRSSGCPAVKIEELPEMSKLSGGIFLIYSKRPALDTPTGPYDHPQKI